MISGADIERIALDCFKDAWFETLPQTYKTDEAKVKRNMQIALRKLWNDALDHIRRGAFQRLSGADGMKEVRAFQDWIDSQKI